MLKPAFRLHLLLAQKWMPARGQWVPVVERMVWRPALVSQVALLRGIVHQRLGRIDAAVARLRRLTAAPGAISIEAAVLLSEVLHFAHRHDELATLVAAGGAC